jgi:hypothetical protein
MDERSATSSVLRGGARRVLTTSWREQDGFCPPNPQVYPHQWLWDSCFHAIAWAALGDARSATELASCLSGQLPHGFVPHMRYLGPSENRGPLLDRSSFTQPPIYAHAARVVRDAGFPVSAAVVGQVEAALEWLWANRSTPDGLLFVLHPWESGSDDSPRWDSWVGISPYSHQAYSELDRWLVGETLFDRYGAAVSSRAFQCAPVAFNAFASHAAAELFALSGNPKWQRRASDLAEAIDGCLWDDRQGLWRDQAIVGGGPSVDIPTLDGVLGALSTDDADKAGRALDQLVDDHRFGAPYGLAFVPRGESCFDPDAYWRGPAWPQLNYMLWIAARRCARPLIASTIATTSVRAALTSGFAEYWNPLSGQGLGAVPQGWAALAAAYPSELEPHG